MFTNVLVAQNLLTNGGFELGGSGNGFLVDGTGYTELTAPFAGTTSAGNYAFVTNPQVLNTASFIVATDHTSGTGKMMVVDGNNAAGNPRFWKAGNTGGGVCGLTVGKKYEFSFWAKSIYDPTIAGSTQPSINVQFTNATSVTPIPSPTSIDVPNSPRQKITYTFVASNACVNIELWNTNTGFPGNDFAVDDFSVNLLPTATISGAATVCVGANTAITFTGANGTPPYTFAYNINGGLTQTVSTTATTNSVTVPIGVNTAASYTYNLVNVESGGFTNVLPASSATVVVENVKGTISGNTTVCLNGTSPIITFTASNCAPPYMFNYNINGGVLQTVYAYTSNTATVTVPTNVAGVYNYNLVSVQNASSTSTEPISTVTVNVLQFNASFSVSIINNVCPGDIETLTINGTPNTTVQIASSSAPTVLIPVTLGASGVGTYTTPAINNTTSYFLVDSTDGTCTNNVSGTVTINVLTFSNDTSGGGPPFVKLQGPTTVCNGGQVTTLTTTFQDKKRTTSYTVTSIPYAPAYSFTSLNQIPIPPLPANQDDFFAGTSSTSPFTLPFNFNFYGNDYDKVVVGSNGLLTFDLGRLGTICDYVNPADLNNSGASTAVTIKNAIFGVWQDIDFTNSPAPPASINYYVANACPTGDNRVFVMNTNEVFLWGDGATHPNGKQSYQIVLYETSNIIDVYVKRRKNTTGNWGGFGIIGLINSTGSNAITAPGRNRFSGPWESLTGEAWRFKPNGTSLSVLKWYKNGVEILPTPATTIVGGVATSTISINANQNDVYTSEVTYLNPDGTQDFVCKILILWMCNHQFLLLILNL